LEELNETSTSVVRRNKSIKRNALAGRSALSICKKQNPALYSKYTKFKARYLKIRKTILSRYKVRGVIAARKHIH